ncbi:MAG: ABC transporter permease [Bullifex sp.]
MKKLLSVILLFVLVLPFFPGDPNEMDLASVLSSPSSEHLLGTDALGRDVLSRLCVGARNSLLIAGSAAILSALIGFLAGTLSLTSKCADEILMRTADAVKALPAVLFASLLMVTSGGGVWTLILVMTAVFTPQCARLVRSEGRKQLASGYFEAAIVTGIRPVKTMLKTVMRHTLPLLRTQLPFIFSAACILEATLSFIGAGVSPEVPTLGQLLSEGRSVFITHPRLVLLPLCILIFFTFCFSLQWKKMSGNSDRSDEKSE